MSGFKSGRKRRFVAGAAAVVGAAAAVGVFAGSAGAAGGPDRFVKPTIVLEHGAFADGSSWNGVVAKLEKAGYPVVAAANPLRGPAADAAQLRSVINRVGGPVILVGHSYGGSVISAAGAGDPRVKALVYVAAFLPAPGESANSLTSEFPGSTLPDAVEAVPVTNADGTAGTDLYIQEAEFRHQFAADLPAKQTALMAAAQRPVAASALAEPATVAAWQDKPTWDVVATQDLNIPAAAQRAMAARAHAHTTEVAASHAVAVSHPDVVAKVIEQAARATR